MVCHPWNSVSRRCAPLRSGQPETSVEGLTLRVEPLALNLENRAATRVGKLAWRGGLSLSADHPMFGRKGRDLTLTVPVTFPEAALGADISVPTLDGSPVTLRIPAGTRSGQTFRVRGRGIDTGKETGDLLVTVEVAVPQKLTAAERKAVEALGQATNASPRAHLGVE